MSDFRCRNNFAENLFSDPELSITANYTITNDSDLFVFTNSAMIMAIVTENIELTNEQFTELYRLSHIRLGLRIEP